MSFGLIALVIAAAGAGWLLFRVARGEAGAGENRNMILLKAVVWLGLAAALFVARLWPLAFMVLVAAGGVMAIEMWRTKTIASEDGGETGRITPAQQMTVEEAMSVLGLDGDAKAEQVRIAHRKLIAQIHPDKGGTDYLAAKINEARDLLLRGLGE